MRFVWPRGLGASAGVDLEGHVHHSRGDIPRGDDTHETENVKVHETVSEASSPAVEAAPQTHRLVLLCVLCNCTRSANTTGRQ